jgi:hypothetical protein
MIVDQLIMAGAPEWQKPAKFTISIAVYVFTLARAFTLIPEWVRARRVVGWATAIAMVLADTHRSNRLAAERPSLQFRHAPRWSPLHDHGNGHRSANVHECGGRGGILAADF